MTRRRSLLLPGLILLALSQTAFGQLADDEWSDQVTFVTGQGWFPAPVHAMLLPDGKLLFIGYERNVVLPELATAERKSEWTLVPTPLGATVPTYRIVANENAPVDVPPVSVPPWTVWEDLLCAGHSLMSDGKVFIAGGSRYYTYNNVFSILLGLPYATIYDGTTWTRVPENMRGRSGLADTLEASNLSPNMRWYPQVNRLPDGRMLVSTGDDLVHYFGTWPLAPNRSVEVYDPQATGNPWTVLSTHELTPAEAWNQDYTHVFQLPTPLAGSEPYDVLMFGSAGLPLLMSTTTETPRWSTRVMARRPGAAPGDEPNHGASSLPLPIRLDDSGLAYRNGSVLMVGGDHHTTHEHNADVYDPQRNIWLPRIETYVRRHHPSSVLLPDGRVMVIAGHNELGNAATGRALLLDPLNGFALNFGNTEFLETRGYHTVTLLLPDGRVLVGGGNVDGSAGTEKPTFRYYHPDYLKQPRPTLSAPSLEMGYATDFTIATSGPITEAVLVGLGSMTHSYDSNQRHIQLQVVNATTLRGPADTRTAPPGHYMLFVLDANRVPSVAKIVRLRQAP